MGCPSSCCTPWAAKRALGTISPAAWLVVSWPSTLPSSSGTKRTSPPPLEALEPLAPAQEPFEPLPFDWRLIDPIMAELRRPDPAWWERLGAITAPTLLISGGPSSHVGRESLERMCGLIPDCRLAIIEGAGHRVHGSRPEEFAAVAGEFLGPA
ncbi:alpha/beta fold hydrolase [Amycolatopsis japonica]|uniref:alpha/beta fold hydrolase n=1 Tax=Amycolatopsis japonica TaxID=208439 RepID=UPI0034036F2E